MVVADVEAAHPGADILQQIRERCGETAAVLWDMLDVRLPDLRRTKHFSEICRLNHADLLVGSWGWVLVWHGRYVAYWSERRWLLREDPFQEEPGSRSSTCARFECEMDALSIAESHRGVYAD